MKINKFKALSIVVCCFVIALCPEIQSMDIRSDQEEETNIKKQLKETKKELELKKYIRKLKLKEEKEKKEYEWEKPSDFDYFIHTHTETDIYKIEKNGEIRFHEVKKTTIFEESYKKESMENYSENKDQECIGTKQITQNIIPNTSNIIEPIYSDGIPDTSYSNSHLSAVSFTSLAVATATGIGLAIPIISILSGSGTGYLPYKIYNYKICRNNYNKINYNENQKSTNAVKINNNKNISE